MERIKKYEPLWGSWKVKRKIGEGSYGAVYEVKKTLLGNTSSSAVKLISFDNAEMLRGINVDETLSAKELEGLKLEAAKKNVREAALMDKLPGRANIVTIYDYGIYSNEKTTDVIIRMELLTNLGEYTNTVKMDTDKVIKFGMDICKALEGCEKEKIIHRDIKPENIFVNKDGDFKLGDFGLSRKMNKSSSFSLRKSKGTLLYMPPEAFGWGQYVDHTSDIYSLGIVMYQLLNDGKIPFCTMKNNFEDEDSAIGKRLDGEAFPPPAHEKGQLWEIIQKACQFNKEDRYQSAFEMKKELEMLKTVCSFHLEKEADSFQQTPISSTGNAESNNNKNLRGGNALLILIGAAILIAAGIFFVRAAGSKKDTDDTHNNITNQATTETQYASDASKQTTEGKEEESNHTESDDQSYSDNDGEVFYGIWCDASKDLSVTKKYAGDLKKQGWKCHIFLTSEWSNLNQKDWYVVSVGIYSSKEEAEKYLEDVQLSRPNAYIKYSGEYLGN